ncbi:tRNA 2'-phosphotransferase 1 isoform X1 [Bufo bufo]|uniref:tRNA 2'-phosphotransferase 1 isoform X1 n=2 Tax=Bufo bufo TaxID=8384 RepID=UPI001ABEBEC9|nr:tRNA 2'-phosphotransferase 1 isoform X1 [Bufo bufo]XP_040266388.1 tRNA 2'-phosphotransferase 1 isoform X1 [Bufo bufo]XP_040266389.1 tRNA 2'-phosphotransferase 1 isoform X1 [Bufo bufo]XP_040266390.1 tRNA 2'-phosphotransferase 1 isoform X1 [Bufo bufo]
MEGSHASHRRRGGRNQDPDVQLSKLLSYALRHGASELGLPMGSDGFVPVSSLLRLQQFRSFSQNDIERVVRCNDKQRFTMRTSEPEGTLEICANQGHSIQVDVNFTPLGAELPPQAIHGTYLRHWPSILRSGLSRMNRAHIHFSTQLPGEGEGVISGMRRDCELAIFIDLPKATADQIPFFWSVNRVLLTPGNADGVLLPKYFLKVLQLRPHRRLLELE